MELRGKKVLVVGLGASGLAAAGLCLDQGAQVSATDMAPNPALAAELAAKGVSLTLGRHQAAEFSAADVLVLSPGVDPRRPEVAAARKAGAQVIGEFGLALRFLRIPTLMITGSNGKSTVTTLAGEMLKASGKKVFVGGNLGAPLAAYAAGAQEDDLAVLEVSSFQIDTAPGIKPGVGVLLNITPDHLDRYRDFEAYAQSKLGLFANQRGDDLALLFADDSEVAKRADLAPAGKWFFSQEGPQQPGGWLSGPDGLSINIPGHDELNFSTAGSKLPGLVNRLNLLAAALAALACGARPEALQKVIDSFPGLPHRIQFAGSIEGVDYYNDSKGTNVGAVAAAVGSLQEPVVLLLGGRDKEGRFAELRPALNGRVKRVFCFGEAGPSIHRQIEGFAPSVLAGSLEDAFQRARQEARPGWAVLLSPGCASFDAYKNYGQRGEHFMQMVREAAHDQPS